MYLECLSCPKLGTQCDGPNFVAMPSSELLEWCKERKKRLGLSNAKLSELSGVPQGTIDRLFADMHCDFKHETMRPLLKALVGGNWSGNPCPNPDDHMEERLHVCEDENKRLREYMIEHEHHYREDIGDVRKEYHERIKGLRFAVIALSIALSITLALVFSFLIIDFLNPDIGYLWLDAH